MRTITLLRKRLDDLASSNAERDRTLKETITLQAATSEEAAENLRPYVDLYVSKLPPTSYHPYFPTDWHTAFHEKTFRADRDWAAHARAFLFDLQKLSPDSRRVLEEGAHLNQESATETPLLGRARQLLSTKPSSIRTNLFELSTEELNQLEAWIDFVLGMGIHQYMTFAEHSEKV